MFLLSLIPPLKCINIHYSSKASYKTNVGVNQMYTNSFQIHELSQSFMGQAKGVIQKWLQLAVHCKHSQSWGMHDSCLNHGSVDSNHWGSMGLFI
jgi:hypothetical protein